MNMGMCPMRCSGCGASCELMEEHLADPEVPCMFRHIFKHPPTGTVTVKR
jgi:hypothetical protein